MRNFPSFYHSHNTVRVIKSRRLRRTELVAKVEEDRSSFKISIVISTEKRPLGRLVLRLESNISTNLKEIDLNTRDWPRIVVIRVLL